MPEFRSWVDPPEADNIIGRAQPNLPKYGLFVQALITPPWKIAISCVGKILCTLKSYEAILTLIRAD
jgi:hypothetical protein